MRDVLPWAFAAVFLSACTGGGRERITLGAAHLPPLGLVFLAEANGDFARHGLAVEHRRFPTGRDALAALAAGEVEAAAAYTTPVAFRAAKDDLRVVTTLHTSARSTRLVARADRGIARPEDLAGKRIGVPLGTNGEYFLHTLLAYGGVEGRAGVVDVAPVAAVDALVAGELDAIVTWPPHCFHARRQLSGAAVELTSPAYLEHSMLVVRAGTLPARHRAVRKLAAALADAERFAREQPREAFELLRAEFPEEVEADLREVWSAVRPAVGVTHQLAESLEREAAWFRARGRIDGPPLDAATILAPEVLAEVDAEAVTFMSPRRGGAP